MRLTSSQNTEGIPRKLTPAGAEEKGSVVGVCLVKAPRRSHPFHDVRSKPRLIVMHIKREASGLARRCPIRPNRTLPTHKKS
jgi:hypothetical protein